MFEFLLTYDNEAIALIVKDHDTVKELFSQYEKAGNRREKLRIAAKTIQELQLHAIIEEEIFYPAIREQLEEDMMNEADEEHHVARFLVAELSGMDGSESHYDAKYKVLSENIRHHIKEEESEMLPKAKSLNLDFKALAATIKARKEQLLRTGIPDSLEDKMVRATPRNDTPAREAKRTQPRPVAKKTASPAMAKAKKGKAAPAKKTPLRSTANAKPGAAKKTATAKKAPNPKLKIVSHRAASSAKSLRKSPSVKPKAKTKR